MKIVDAQKEDAPLIGRVVVEAIGPELARDFAGGRDVEDVVNLFATLAAREDSQYSYLNTLKAVDDSGRPMGFLVGYDGALLHELRRAFFEEVRRQMGRDMEGQVRDECSPDYFYLDSLCTFPDFRGQGVAGALIRAMAERAASRGKRLSLLVEKTNTRARSLYDSIGFKFLEEREFAGEMMDYLVL